MLRTSTDAVEYWNEKRRKIRMSCSNNLKSWLKSEFSENRNVVERSKYNCVGWLQVIWVNKITAFESENMRQSTSSKQNYFWFLNFQNYSILSHFATRHRWSIESASSYTSVRTVFIRFQPLLTRYFNKFFALTFLFREHAKKKKDWNALLQLVTLKFELKNQPLNRYEKNGVAIGWKRAGLCWFS